MYSYFLILGTADNIKKEHGLAKIEVRTTRGLIPVYLDKEVPSEVIEEIKLGDRLGLKGRPSTEDGQVILTADRIIIIQRKSPEDETDW